MPSLRATVAAVFGICASGVQVATITRSMSPEERPLAASALPPAATAMSATVWAGPRSPPPPLEGAARERGAGRRAAAALPAAPTPGPGRARGAGRGRPAGGAARDRPGGGRDQQPPLRRVAVGVGVVAGIGPGGS